jgi:hypothetical protein
MSMLFGPVERGELVLTCRRGFSARFLWLMLEVSMDPARIQQLGETSIAKLTHGIYTSDMCNRPNQRPHLHRFVDLGEASPECIVQEQPIGSPPTPICWIHVS